MRPPFDLQLLYQRLSFRRTRRMRSPLVYQTLSWFVANADCGVRAFTDTGFQASDDARALGSVEVAVSDVEVGVDDVVVPAFEECGDVFLHHCVGGAHADL